MAYPVLVFFYGSYMNRAVLAEVGLAPERWEPAMLWGYDIRISPRANLVRARDHVVFGVLATATHEELRQLYAHATSVLGEVYLPEAVLVQGQGGKFEPALCYIAPEMDDAPADPEYVDRILKPLQEMDVPEWYLVRIASFLDKEDHR